MGAGLRVLGSHKTSSRHFHKHESAGKFAGKSRSEIEDLIRRGRHADGVLTDKDGNVTAVYGGTYDSRLKTPGTTVDADALNQEGGWFTYGHIGSTEQTSKTFGGSASISAIKTLVASKWKGMSVVSPEATYSFEKTGDFDAKKVNTYLNRLSNLERQRTRRVGEHKNLNLSQQLYWNAYEKFKSQGYSGTKLKEMARVEQVKKYQKWWTDKLSTKGIKVTETKTN